MSKIKGFMVISLLFQIILFGCATGKKSSQAEIFNQYDSISQLNREIFRAKDIETNSYSPQLFKKSPDAAGRVDPVGPGRRQRESGQ